jgi:hypothetical protein
MKLASWFPTHPPLVKRAAALAPDLVPKDHDETLSTAGALLIVVILIAIPVGIGFKVIPDMIHTFEAASKAAIMMHGSPSPIGQMQIKPNPQYRLNNQ